MDAPSCYRHTRATMADMLYASMLYLVVRRHVDYRRVSSMMCLSS